MLTLNNIIERISQFVDYHEQLNTFQFGEIEEQGETSTVYPALFIDLSDPSSEFDEQTDSYYFDVMVLDKPNTENEYVSTKECLSDTKLISNDFVAWLKKNEWGQTVRLDLPISMQSLTVGGEDSYAGWTFTFKITLAQGVDFCAVPFTGVVAPPYVLPMIANNVVSLVSGLTYSVGNGPSNESTPFRIKARGLTPASGTIYIEQEVGGGVVEIWNGTIWSDSHTLSYTNGQIDTAEIFKVRTMAGLSAGTYEENIQVRGGDAQTRVFEVHIIITT